LDYKTSPVLLQLGKLYKYELSDINHTAQAAVKLYELVKYY